MATNVCWDQGEQQDHVLLQGRVVRAEGSDFMLDSAERRNGGGPHRRALVHDQGDGLTINFANDYPGGLNLNGVNQLVPRAQPGDAGIPTVAVRGDLTYEVQGMRLHEPGRPGPGSRTIVTVSLSAELNRLQTQIDQLEAKLAALGGR